MRSLELKPDLAIFPFDGSTTTTTISKTVTGTRESSSDTGTAPTIGPRPVGKKQLTLFDQNEEDPTGLMEAWSKPGMGPYNAKLSGPWPSFMIDND